MKLSEQIKSVIDQDHMSDDQLEIFKAHLLSEREEIAQFIQFDTEQLKGGQEKNSDEADAASQFEELTLTINNRESLLRRLALINRTLSNIENGDYGFCDECGIEININRLVVNPTSKACIDCQAVSERVGQGYLANSQ